MKWSSPFLNVFKVGAATIWSGNPFHEEITLTGYWRLYLCDRFFEQKMAENEDKNTHSLENNGYYSSISFVSVIQILANTR